MSPTRRRVSIFILAVLALQAVPVARELTGARETLWPFLAWGMFRHSSGPPVEATRVRVLAATPSGERAVGPGDAGFDRFAFRRLYSRPIAAGDSLAARDLGRRLARRWETRVEAIIVEETRFAIGPDGVESRDRSRRSFALSRGGSSR